MIKIYFNYLLESERELNSTFNYISDDTWFNDLTDEIIKDIEKSETNGHTSFKSDLFGYYGPSQLGHGVKNLITMLNLDKFKLITGKEIVLFNTAYLSDNCIDWLIKVADIVEWDIHLLMTNVIYFPDNYNVILPEFDSKVVNGDGLYKHLISPEGFELMNGCPMITLFHIIK